MGRSIEVPRDAISVSYRWIDEGDEFAYDDLVEDVQAVLMDRFNSLELDNRWLPYPCRETRAVLENGLIRVCVSEYCGLVAISVIPRDDAPRGMAERDGLLVGRYIEDKFGELRKQGTFSNGESFYTRKES